MIHEVRSEKVPRCYRFGFNGQEKDDEVYGATGTAYTAEFWEYDTRTGKRWNIDPVTKPWMSPYHAFSNNPVAKIDPNGANDDWVQDADGNIKWDKDANSQATTKAGETYLGTTLTFNFNSYIDGELWDGPSPPFIDPAGDKLTSTVVIGSAENDEGELIAFGAVHKTLIGETPVGTARDYYPGLGADQNKFSYDQELGANGLIGNFSLNYEQHASVAPAEELVLNGLGYYIVNVAQKLSISYTAGGTLSVTSYTDVFPSATLTVNGKTTTQYNQPSFVETHGGRKSGDGYKPASWQLIR